MQKALPLPSLESSEAALAEASSAKKRTELKDAIFNTEQKDGPSDSDADGAGPVRRKSFLFIEYRPCSHPTRQCLNTLSASGALLLGSYNKSAKIAACGSVLLWKKDRCVSGDIVNKQA